MPTIDQIMKPYIKARIAIEKRIAKQCIFDLLAAGYCITVHDGEADCLVHSRDAKAILAAMRSTDDDVLKVYAPRPDNPDEMQSMGWVYFVYGNDGWDVINDYTTNLESVLARTNALIKTLEN